MKGFGEDILELTQELRKELDNSTTANIQFDPIFERFRILDWQLKIWRSKEACRNCFRNLNNFSQTIKKALEFHQEYN